MAQAWRTIRVFISSTFRDMHSERDHLVRFVFPRLREELLRRRIHLVDVDLRWGVTAEQDALEVCRQVIDECRPRFLCLLGERYGWVPPGREQSITAQEIDYAALLASQDRAHRFFYFRDPAITATIPEAEAGSFREPTGSPGQRRLAALKEAIVSAGYTPFVYSCHWDPGQGRLVGLEGMGDRVYSDLLASVEAELGPVLPERLDEFTEEAAAVEAFVEERVAHYVVGDRRPLFERLHDHARGIGEPAILCLVGEAGSGKSALLARFYRERLQASHGDERVIAHFVGASAMSTNVRPMLRRLCYELAAGNGQEMLIPEDQEELFAAFPSFLARAAAGRRVVLLVDAVNQLDLAPGTPAMRWLPEELPPGVRVILSALPGPALEMLRARRHPPGQVALQPLSLHDAGAIVDDFFHRYGKRLDSAQRAALLAKQDSGRPLYLLTALEELRTLGTYEEITGRIRSLPGETESLFRWILQRLENDPGFRDDRGQPIGPALVRRCFTYLAAGRFGMEQRELVDLVDPGDPQGNVAALQRLVRPYLLLRGHLLDFFHTQFRAAVENVYLDEAWERLAAHRALAACFLQQAGDGDWHRGTPRALGELPHHLLQSRDLSALDSLYGDPSFLEATCLLVNARTTPAGEMEYGGIFDLLSQLQGTLRLIEQPDMGAPAGLALQLRALFELLAARSPLLRRFPRAVSQEISNYLGLLPGAAFSPGLLQRAREEARPGLLLANRESLAPPVIGHSAAVTALAICPSGDRFLSGAADGSVAYWQVGSPLPLWLVGAHKSWVTHIALSPDGRQALSSGDDGLVLLWDLTLGTRRPAPLPRTVLDDVTPWLQAALCAFLDDQTFLAIRGGICGCVDLRSESERWSKTGLGHGQLRAHSHASDLDHAPQVGRFLVGGDSKQEIKVWDAADGCVRFTFQVPGAVRAVALSADGATAVVSDAQGRLVGFDLAAGRQLGSAQTRPVYTLCRAPSGPRFFGFDNHGRLLDIRVQGELLVRTSPELDELQYPTPPNFMACLPDGRTLVVGRESGAIALVDTEEARIVGEWPPGSTLARGTIFPGGQEAMGIAGSRTVDEVGQGDTLLFIAPSGAKVQPMELPHHHFISDVAALGPQQALTVDRGGVAAVWQGGRVSRVHEIAGAELTACTAWSDGGTGAAGTLDERVLILGDNVQEIPLPSTSHEFRAGIVALAVAGNPPGVFAAYFNGLVRFQRQGAGWQGPEKRRHTLRASAAALDGGCTLAAAGDINGEVRLWRCQDGRLEAEFALHAGEVTALAFDPAGRLLYSAGADRFLYAIDLAGNRIVHATVLPLLPIALRPEGDRCLFVLDCGGSLFRFHVQ